MIGSYRLKVIVVGCGAAFCSLLALVFLSVVGCGGVAENPAGSNGQTVRSADTDGSSTAAEMRPGSTATGSTRPKAENVTGAGSAPGMPDVQLPTAESLKAVATAWQKARYSDAPATRVATVEALLVQPLMRRIS